MASPPAVCVLCFPVRCVEEIERPLAQALEAWVLQQALAGLTLGGRLDEAEALCAQVGQHRHTVDTDTQTLDTHTQTQDGQTSRQRGWIWLGNTSCTLRFDLGAEVYPASQAAPLVN